MINGLSTIAIKVNKLKDGADRTKPAHGFCYHTTGSTIVEKALKLGLDPLEYAINYYLKPDSYWAHFVGHKDRIVQISDEREKALHVGLKAEERTAYLKGTWEKQVAKITCDVWKYHWQLSGSFFKSPSHFYPGPSVNNVYIGYEMVPEIHPLEYLDSTVRNMCRQAHDTAKRQGFFKPDWWYLSGRFVSHEDLNPISRSNKYGGWDVGHLKAKPTLERRFVDEFMYETEKEFK